MRKLLTLSILIAIHAGAQSEPTNFHEVTPDILRGARIEDPLQADYLVKNRHVKTVIDLQGGDLTDTKLNKITNGAWENSAFPKVEAGETPEEIAAEKKQLTLAGLDPSGFLNPALDSVAEVTPQESHKIMGILDKMADPNTPRPIYVHCAHGADRTGLVIALYRVFVQGWTAKKAHEEMEDMGHNFLHRIFTSDMDKYFWHAVGHLNQQNHFHYKVPDNDIQSDFQITWNHLLSKLPWSSKDCHCKKEENPL